MASFRPSVKFLLLSIPPLAILSPLFAMVAFVTEEESEGKSKKRCPQHKKEGEVFQWGHQFQETTVYKGNIPSLSDFL